MNNCMTFPDTVEEFMEQYKIVDTEHVYTNGVEMVPIFRMKQWFEHQNVDLVSRQAAIDAVYKCTDIFVNNLPVMVDKADAYKALAELPSAQPIIVPCDYVKACNEVTMNKVISAVAYYDALEELRKHGYVLVEMREKQDEWREP